MPAERQEVQGEVGVLGDVWGSGSPRVVRLTAVLFPQGPEFVRKHIFNKHAEKIEEVKKEVVFFNNFLMDSKRPALPEVKPIQAPMAGQGKC